MIPQRDPRFIVIDRAAFAAKNLYNATTYLMRQVYIFHGERILSYEDLYHEAKMLPAYQDLPRKVAQQVIKLVQKNWKAFQAARAAWNADPGGFQRPPGLPGYLDKQAGRGVLIYTNQALSRPAYREGRIIPSGLDILVETRQTDIQ